MLATDATLAVNNLAEICLNPFGSAVVTCRRSDLNVGNRKD